VPVGAGKGIGSYVNYVVIEHNITFRALLIERLTVKLLISFNNPKNGREKCTMDGAIMRFF
jgi:hypothetical protein